VYVANLDGKNLSGYAVDRDNGALRALPWAPLALKHWPFRLVRNPRLDVAYFFTENGQLETFSTRNGIRPQLSSIAFPRGLGGNLLVDPLARWLYGAGSWEKTVTVYGMDPRTGGLTPSSTSAFAFPNGPRSMVSDSQGRFLYVNTVRDRKEAAAVLGYRIDARKRALRPLPSWPYGGATGGNGLTITPDDRFLYATNFDSKSVAGFAVDRRTGAFRPIAGSPFKAGDTPDDIVSCIRVSNACVPAP
jgi:6-phosphogluconolactonase (cycloisomerase 2 family)